MNDNPSHRGPKDTTFLDLTLSEIELLRDTRFFEKKRLVTGKITGAFASLESFLRDQTLQSGSLIPADLLDKRGKISKGENYLGLPYVVLDYPAGFSRVGVFALRTMFWWGHGFSFTLHISGKYLEQLSPDFFSNAVNLKEGYFLCCSHGEWDHHYEKTNYIPSMEYGKSGEELMQETKRRNFIKIHYRFDETIARQMNEPAFKFLTETKLLKSR